MPIRVLTLNLWNTSGPYRERRARIRAWIERLKPDVIGLQEAVRSASFDQVADLLDGFGYAYAYAKAQPFWLDPSQDFGNAVASRWPILAQEICPLPDAGDAEHRVAFRVRLQTPHSEVSQGLLSVTTTHLNWKLHHGYVRERQIVTACAFARADRAAVGMPVLLMGDFNAEPESAEIRYVRGLQSLQGRSMHFRDAWRMAGNGDGATWSNRNPYTIEAREPDRRIDYIFTTPPRSDGVGAIDLCQVVCDDALDGVWPSDHFGVYAELRTEPLTGANP